MSNCRPFHLACGVADIEKARDFYKNVLGLEEGRSDTTWVDFNFFGHQLVFHLDYDAKSQAVFGGVDSKNVPIPHFGVLLEFDQWQDLANKIKDNNIDFAIEPYIRFKGEKGEQGTFFFYDPNGLALEFKYFKSDEDIFDN